MDRKKVRKAIKELRGFMRDCLSRGVWLVGRYYGVKVEGGDVSPWWGSSTERFYEKGVITLIRPYSSRDIRKFLREKLDKLVDEVFRENIQSRPQ